MLTRLLLALLCQRLWGKRVDMQQVERNILSVDSTGGEAVESNNSRMSVDMQQVERNIISVEASPPMLSAGGCPDSEADPNVLINKYIRDYRGQALKKGLDTHINIIVRPVSDDARQLICHGQALGKGMDILPKSSKCKSPSFKKGNEGYVSYCQSCNPKWWKKNPEFDLYGPFVDVNLTTDEAMASIKNDVMANAFKVWETLTQKQRTQVQGGSIHGVCQYLASQDIHPGKKKDKKCFTTCRDGYDKQNEALQEKAATLIADPVKDKPYGVAKRVIRMMTHVILLDGTPRTEYVPFFAYELDSKVTRPVVSDYDIFTVGEFPVPGETDPQRRYPLMNLVPQLWDHTSKAGSVLKMLVESTFGQGFSERKDKSKGPATKTEKGQQVYGNAVGHKFALSQAAAITILLDDILPAIDTSGRSGAVAKFITYQAYGDPGSLLVSADLITRSSNVGTNAVAHHMETFNYHNVQQLPLNEHHTIFWGDDQNPTETPLSTGVRKTKNANGMGTIDGLPKLVITYHDLLTKGWCLPFNYGWLRLDEGVARGVGHQMSTLFIYGYDLALQGPLQGCPFYDVRVMSAIITQILEYILTKYSISPSETAPITDVGAAALAAYPKLAEKLKVNKGDRKDSAKK